MIKKSSLPVTKTTLALGVTPKGYYEWLKREKTATQPKDFALREKIKSLAAKFSTHGYRRMTTTLRSKYGERVNGKKVFRIMREENLQVRKKKYTPKTTQSNHKFPKHPNLFNGIVPQKVNAVWVSDITFIPLGGFFVYLAVIMDVFSRKCVGWALSKNPDTALTKQALIMALKSRGNNVAGCIHHSDQGVQYASAEYVRKLLDNGMRPSMGEVGNSYENAHAESFIKTIKNEEVWINEYENVEQLYNGIKNYMKLYNTERVHSSIGYKTPVEYEKEYKKALSVA